MPVLSFRNPLHPMPRGDLIKEVREGRVVQALLVYLGASWVVLQIVEVLQQAVGLPQSAWGLVFLFLFVGLVIVLATAWVQSRPNTKAREEAGEVPTDWEVAPREALKTLMAGRIPHLTWGRVFAGGVVAMCLWAVVATFLLFHQRATSRGPSSAELRSIAVTPFSDLSPNGDQEYFSDGLSEELLDLLVKVPALRVTARSSSFSYRGEDVRVAGQELGVSHVLEGSVRKNGDRIRINVGLVEISTGSTVWSERYDRTTGDIFQLQEDIAESVVDALKVQLLGEGPRVTKTDPEAHRLTLEGRFLLDRYDGGEGARIETAFRNALRLDPDYAPAWMGLAQLYNVRANFGGGDPGQDVAMARESVERALSLDPGLADAWAILADIRKGVDWDFPGAEEAIQSALELEPGNGKVLLFAAVIYKTSGRFDDALELIERAITLDPMNLFARSSRGLIFLETGQIPEAEAAIREVLALDPALPGANGMLSFVLVLSGRGTEALDQIEREPIEPVRAHGRALALHAVGGRQDEADDALRLFIERFGHVGSYQVAELYAFRGDPELAFEWLDRALANRDAGLTEMIGDPFFADLWADRRWKEMLVRVGLPTGTFASSR